MPWDESHVKVFEMQKPQRMAIDIARSGCYERAVAILRNTEHTGTQQATAEALHRLLTAAGAGSVPAEGSQQDAELKHQEQLKAESAWQDKLQAKANRQQLRRERQQQRHEQSMALRRHKYVDKVNALQKAFEDRVTKQKEQQTSSLQQLMEQQCSLQQQLARHQESLAHSLSSMPEDNNEQALTTLQLQLKVAQTKRGQAEKQLQLVRLVLCTPRNQ